ncbi:MAG: hypothetical protein HPY79_12215 [Bacteroidales bacterium]|nr:hypothetical protein [Bacteroidales bacterium]
MLLINSLLIFGQNNNENCSNFSLIGYVNQGTKVNYSTIESFLHEKSIKIIDSCYIDGLILIELNEKNKDAYQLVQSIEKEFGGECFVKFNIKSFYDSACKEEIIKNKLKETTFN